jgi:hypothetical protein
MQPCGKKSQRVEGHSTKKNILPIKSWIFNHFNLKNETQFYMV